MENNDNHDDTIKKLRTDKKGRVFVRNLPFSVTEEKLREHFSKYGEVKEVIIIYLINRLIYQRKKRIQGN